MKRVLACTFLCLALASSSGCRHRYPKRPYEKGAEPEVALLLQAMDARYGALRVPKAKIREGRSPAARLLLLAEAPQRMRGTIQVAGNPLVELALNEEGYALRNLRGQPGLSEGYYHGPPSRCSVRSLLGVDLATEQLVNLLLGGGPLIGGPHEVTERAWKKGRERLVLRNQNFEQRLEFAWVAGEWWFAGSSLYLIQGEQLDWLWTIRHTELEPRAGGVAPKKTQIRRPVPGDTIELNITYQQQVLEGSSPEPDDSGESGDDGGEDEGWNDEGGWEDDDEGWEEDGEVAEAQPEAKPEPEPPAEPIPAAYLLSAGGLVDRGDLCQP